MSGRVYARFPIFILYWLFRAYTQSELITSLLKCENKKKYFTGSLLEHNSDITLTWVIVTLLTLLCLLTASFDTTPFTSSFSVELSLSLAVVEDLLNCLNTATCGVLGVPLFTEVVSPEDWFCGDEGADLS